MTSHASLEPKKVGVHHKHQPLPWIKSTLKIARCCPLVSQGFSNFLGLFQVMKWQTPKVFRKVGVSRSLAWYIESVIAVFPKRSFELIVGFYM